MRLPERLLAIHRSLEEAGLPHAFGGAIALAYWTLDPRGTSDIDVNIFVPASEAERALRALPRGVDVTSEAIVKAGEGGQVRVFWGDTPIDVFLDYEDLHRAAARNHRVVGFAGEMIPVLGPVELAVFKAVFDRTRDWADIEAMLAAETLDVDATRGHLARLLGAEDPRLERLAAAIRRADAGRPEAS
jgi:hypothetical protein